MIDISLTVCLQLVVIVQHLLVLNGLARIRDELKRQLRVVDGRTSTHTVPCRTHIVVVNAAMVVIELILWLLPRIMGLGPRVTMITIEDRCTSLDLDHVPSAAGTHCVVDRLCLHLLCIDRLMMFVLPRLLT